MARGHLRKAGNITAAFLAIFVSGTAVWAAALETEIEDARIAVGESTTLRIRVQGGSGEMKPLRYPAVPGLEISYSGMQQRYEFINGRSRSGVEILFSVTGLQEGRYTIPPFTFTRQGTRLESRAVTITVTRAAAATPGGREVTRIDISGRVELTGRRVFTGETLVMRYFLVSAGTAVQLQGFERLPEAKGFVMKKIDETGLPPSDDGESQKAYITSFILIPAGAGAYPVGGGVAAIVVEEAGSGMGGFNFPGMARPRALPFPEERIEVAPLPPGAPAGFHGDVGAFTITADCPRDDVPLYAEKRITVIVKGSGNLLSMSRPECLGCDGLRVIGEDGEAKYEVKGNAVTGEKKFQFTIIPEREGAVEGLRFRFVAFNPRRGAYDTLESAPVSFTVKGGKKNKGGEGFDGDREDRMDMNPLYLVLLVLVVGGAVVAVVLWERKRYRIVTAPPKQDESDAVRAEAPREDPATGINRALLTRDTVLFMKEAERFIAAIEKDPAAKEWPPDRRARTEALRQEIYSIKYGGGAITPGDMALLGDRLLSLKK